MDAPGMSLFHGGENIRTNTSDIDEEAELQRHKSIEKGLNDFLGNDLLDLDETEASSAQSQLYNNVGRHNNIQNGTNHFYSRPMNHNGHVDQYSNEEINRLKDVAESKNREVDHVSKLLLAERSRNDDLTKRLTVTEAEKERAFMQKRQFHELLIESKSQISDLEDDITNLKAKIKGLEKTNTELVCDLENTKTSLNDLQLKYHIIEKDTQTNRQVDTILKQANDRHTAQAYMLQQEMNNLRNKLDEKELETTNLQARYNELQKSRKVLLEENSERERELQIKIEEYQRNAENACQENLLLKKSIQYLERDKSDLQRSISQLKSTSPINGNHHNHNSNHEETINFFRKNRSSIIESTPINVSDEISRLKKELQKSRQETELLQEKLKIKIEENDQLRDDENDALVRMSKYKDECQRLNGKILLLESESEQNSALKHQKNRLNELEDEIEKLQKLNEDLLSERDALYERCNSQNVSNDEIKELKNEMDECKQMLNDARNECDRIKDSYVELSRAKNAVDDELTKLKNRDIHNELAEQKEKYLSLENAFETIQFKYSELEKRLKEEKEKKAEEKNTSKIDRNLSISCAKCIDQKTQIAKLEIENLQLTNSCANYLKEITDLKESIKNLSNVVEMKKEYDIMLNELKVQAKEFSQIVQMQSVAKSPKSIESRDQSVSTTPDLDDNSQSRDIEVKMSKIMSAKIKQIEDESIEQKMELQRTIELLKIELQTALTNLKMREKEVDMLKQALLIDRRNLNERIIQIQAEASSQMQDVIIKLQNEIENLKKELDEKIEIERVERESMVVLKKKCQEIEIALTKDIKHLQKTIADFEVEKSEIIKRLNKKYESAVKRGDHYRDYAEAKEEHIIAESARIKEAYQTKLTKMQQKYVDKLEAALKDKEKEHNERITKIEEEWRNKIMSL